MNTGWNFPHILLHKHFMKRLFDMMAAFAGLIVFSPILLIAAIAVLVFEGWPVLFRQQRIGRGGHKFELVKFRTMMVQQTGDRNGFDAGSRKRLTWLGRFLRRTKLDELIQLWNVLVGDMSIVGPRPEVHKWTEAYPERWVVVHTVRPGITDPASIVFRNEEDILAAQADPETYYRNVVLPRKLDRYEEYVQTRTFWVDLKILLRTVWAVIAR
jgi:lipopolysaccharide/colanic/teichoic acid biosynthesis glycosyltransferase